MSRDRQYDKLINLLGEAFNSGNLEYTLFSKQVCPYFAYLICLPVHSLQIRIYCCEVNRIAGMTAKSETVHFHFVKYTSFRNVLQLKLVHYNHSYILRRTPVHCTNRYLEKSVNFIQRSAYMYNSDRNQNSIHSLPKMTVLCDVIFILTAVRN